jgi:hypothetical protein
MAKSTKMGPKKLRLIGSPEIARDVRNKKAREVRAFKKEKQMKEDAQPPVVRTVKRPEKKAK